ncbi:MAG TPA: hypothetical protein DIU15_01950 [Deltaproteobacteria bacterium]|nr:hypothetical protein [Deltaproteobacteria bacterium]HCP44782.1 hypothetical protein [Deltaproteobacteria bacterium]
MKHRTQPTRALRFARHQQGLTLIEIVVVLTLVGALMLAAVPSLRAVFEVDLRTASRELAATLRYVYEEAAVQNVSMRVAYDLDHRSWWVEGADSDVRIFANRDEKEAFLEFQEQKALSDAQLKEQMDNRRSAQPTLQDLTSSLLGDDADPSALSGIMGGLMGGGNIFGGGAAGRYEVNQFSPMNDSRGMFRKRELPSGTRFFGVWTPEAEDVVRPMDEFEVEAMLREEPEDQKWRMAYTHIFPGGYMEDTVVYLSDDEGQSITSLVVDPLIGRVRVVRDEADVPDLRARERD